MIVYFVVYVMWCIQGNGGIVIGYCIDVVVFVIGDVVDGQVCCVCIVFVVGGVFGDLYVGVFFVVYYGEFVCVDFWYDWCFWLCYCGIDQCQ